MHRITAWLALFGYLIVASGLPLPVGIPGPVAADSAAAKRLAGKDRSQPFPCMEKPCGCATAEQCFSNCCCNTPAELLAWAKANRIDLAVIAALQRRVAVATPQPRSACCSGNQSCCSEEPAATTCATGVEIRSEDDSLAAADDDEEPASGAGRERSVVLRAMLACGGIAAQWFSSGVSLPLPPPVTAAHTARAIGIIALTDDESSLDRAPPDAPPPRVG